MCRRLSPVYNTCATAVSKHHHASPANKMPPSTATSLSLPERLQSFEDYWDDDEAAARQLAAIGHVYDRPPLAALEEGTYCISCGAFAKRTDSVPTLQGSLFKGPSRREIGPKTFSFHHSTCLRLQLRIPLEIHTSPGLLGRLMQSGLQLSCSSWSPRLLGGLVKSHGNRENPVSPCQREEGSTDISVPSSQSHPLSNLPAEIRAEIYTLIMPRMEPVTTIVTTNREGTRLTTWAGSRNLRVDAPSKLNLLRSCRAIHEDARDVLFHATTFKLDSTRLLYLFLRHIGAHGRQLLRSVDVVCGSREDAIAFALLAACPKLRSITIRLARGTLLPGNRSSLWILDGVACLLELSGLERVTFGECSISPYLHHDTHDGGLVQRELTRPKGAPSGIRWVDGYPDL